MEVKIPFTKYTFQSEYSEKELKYRAILSRDSLFFGCFNLENKLIHLDSIDVDKVELSAKKNSNKFKSKVVAFNNPLFSFFTRRDYKAFDKESLFKFQHGLNQIGRYNIYDDSIDNPNLKVSYAIPKKMIKSIKREIGDFIPVHYQTIFLSQNKVTSTQESVFISLLGTNLNISLWKYGDLVLSNSYRVHNESDFYYYVALLFDQFNLVKGRTKFYIDGELSKVKFDLSRFVQYFALSKTDVEVYNETKSVSMPLINLNRCASLVEA